MLLRPKHVKIAVFGTFWVPKNAKKAILTWSSLIKMTLKISHYVATWLNNFFKMNPKISICKNQKIDFFARECKYFTTFSGR
jgi:hypothetical protein